MKKSLLFLSLSAMALSLFTFGGKKAVDNNYFIDCGYDALENNAKVERLNANGAAEDKKGANKEAGNNASMASSKIGAQAGVNDKEQNCMRFAVAVPSLNVEVVFNRTLTKTDGTVSYGQVIAKNAYESLAAGDGEVTPMSWNNQFTGAEYNYFVVYTMSGIPDSETNAVLEVSATITVLAEETEDKSSGPVLNAAPSDPVVVEVYKSATFNGIDHKTPNGDLIPEEYRYDGFDKINTGDVIVDSRTGCSYTVTKDSDGNLTVNASSGAYSGGNTIELSSVYVEIGGEIIEIPVVQVSSTFSKDLNNVSTSITSIEIPASVLIIDASSFGTLNKLSTIVYQGTPEQWNAINVSSTAFQNGKQGKNKISVICNDGKSYILNTNTGDIDVNAGIPAVAQGIK